MIQCCFGFTQMFDFGLGKCFGSLRQCSFDFGTHLLNVSIRCNALLLQMLLYASNTTDGLMSAVERNAQRDKGFATVFLRSFNCCLENNKTAAIDTKISARLIMPIVSFPSYDATSYRWLILLTSIIIQFQYFSNFRQRCRSEIPGRPEVLFLFQCF